MSRGIDIPREIADAEGVPEDLDSNIVGPYRFPSPRRRRLAAWVYLAFAALSVVLALGVLPIGMLWVAAAFAVLGAVHLVSAHELALDEADALAAAAATVSFAVGHASAALRFEGWRAYPVWNVLVYDAEDPPTQRALAFIDGKTGRPRRPPFVDNIEPPTPT